MLRLGYNEAVSTALSVFLFFLFNFFTGTPALLSFARVLENKKNHLSHDLCTMFLLWDRIIRYFIFGVVLIII